MLSSSHELTNGSISFSRQLYLHGGAHDCKHTIVCTLLCAYNPVNGVSTTLLTHGRPTVRPNRFRWKFRRCHLTQIWPGSDESEVRSQKGGLTSPESIMPGMGHASQQTLTVQPFGRVWSVLPRLKAQHHHTIVHFHILALMLRAADAQGGGIVRNTVLVDVPERVRIIGPDLAGVITQPLRHQLPSHMPLLSFTPPRILDIGRCVYAWCCHLRQINTSLQPSSAY